MVRYLCVYGYQIPYSWLGLIDNHNWIWVWICWCLLSASFTIKNELKKENLTFNPSAITRHIASLASLILKALCSFFSSADLKLLIFSQNFHYASPPWNVQSSGALFTFSEEKFVKAWSRKVNGNLSWFPSQFSTLIIAPNKRREAHRGRTRVSPSGFMPRTSSGASADHQRWRIRPDLS